MACQYFSVGVFHTYGDKWDSLPAERIGDHAAYFAIGRSGVGQAFYHQKAMLEQAGVAVTESWDTHADAVHINTVLPDAVFAALRAAAGHAEVLNVAVLPDCGRKGVGCELFSRALEELRKSGSWRVSLEAAQDNGPALALYRKAGFKPFGRRKDFYGPGRDALVLGVEI